MKKSLCVILTAMMVLCMASSVLAASSSSSSSASTTATVYADSTATAVATANATVVATENTTAAHAIDTTCEGATVMAYPQFDVTDVQVAASVDALVANGEVTKGATVAAEVVYVANVSGTAGTPFVLHIAGIKATDKLVAIHRKANMQYEYVPAIAGDGTATVTLSSFSPIAIVKVSETSATTAAAATATGVTSPKTGVSTMYVVLAAIAACGAAVCVKKAH